MKTDVLTLVVIVFCVGVLASTLDIQKVFAAKQTPPTALQQGVATR